MVPHLTDKEGTMELRQERFPSLSREALYIEAISTRPGFTCEEVPEMVYEWSLEGNFHTWKMSFMSWTD